MKIVYQGKTEETDVATVDAFLASHGVGSGVIVEYNGEIIADVASRTMALEEGSELNVYRIVSGG
ncbi:MAG: MoaD/ThiS family protein [Kiritimatiellae bacterium]|nr:MoaD/ThiS family protein [Kiritimatiellia bacterium]